MEIVSDADAFDVSEAPVLSSNSKDLYLFTNDAAIAVGVYQVEVSFFF